MESGVVTDYNPSRGMFVLRDSRGEHYVFELLDDDVEVGDALRAPDFNVLGDCTLFRGRDEISAYGQSGWCSHATALRMIA